MRGLLKRAWYARKPEDEQIGLKGLEEVEAALHRIPLSYQEGQKAAIRVGKESYISIPDDRYIEVAKGVFDRVVKNADDVTYEHEKPFARKLKELDFENYVVVFVKFKQGGDFKAHYHPVIEYIHCLEGSYVGTEEGHLFSAGDLQIIPAFEVHVFRPVDDGYCLIALKKE